ncbi:hypothetical protein ASPCADRAFT_133432 [Aspergillus carbonarius ITEM 5010]|uniref:Uncharacterized protein n=1 Tax=Aspergillus carbonarius (strain ITEM 5010) TaxID=602072 RepID=A0A1R3RD59_ASPC5|nr:hypothetical protein ASPCADRAFT_133432 [Aspergillus carbonarius ITEM 5010]
MCLATEYRAALAEYSIDEKVLNVPPELEPIMPTGVRYRIAQCLNKVIGVLAARDRYRPQFTQKYAERFNYLCSAAGETYNQHRESVRAIQEWIPPKKIPQNRIHLGPFGADYDLFVYRELLALEEEEMEEYAAYRADTQQVESMLHGEVVGEALTASLAWWRSGFLREMQKWIDGGKRLHMPTRQDTVKELSDLIRERVEDGDRVAQMFVQEASAN